MLRTSLVALTVLFTVAAASSSAGVHAPSTRADVHFVNPSVGWVVAGPAVFGTHDGGRIWRRELSVRGLLAVDAVDAEHAWALTARSLFATKDGGRSWTSHALPRKAVALDFVDANRGWVVDGQGGITATSDGGTTWRDLHSPASIDAACLASPTRAFAADGGTVFATSDGGETWSRVLRAPSAGQRWTPTLHCRGDGVWVQFVGGVAAGSQGYAAYSAPDGVHWRLVLGQFLRRRAPRLSSYAGPFSVVAPSSALFVGYCPACGHGTSIVARTRDGGLHWRRSKPGLDGYRPEAASFVDDTTGFVVTGSWAHDRWVVWKTTDAGRTLSRALSVRR